MACRTVVGGINPDWRGDLGRSGRGVRYQAAEQAVRQARRFPVPDNNSQFERYFRRFYFCSSPRFIALGYPYCHATVVVIEPLLKK